ncbi:MAG: RidA family protein [Chloroflexota bacterium]
MSSGWHKEIVQAEGAPPLLARTSAHAIRIGPLLFVTGQTGRRPDGNGFSSDPAEQARQTMENVKAIVEAGGSSMANVVKRTLIVRDAAAYERMKPVIEGYFPSPVASTTMQGTPLNDAAWLEVDVVALVPSG